MPGAGFYSIHTSKLTFRGDGRWYADEDPVIHERLAQLFSRYVRRKPTGDGYEIWIDERYHSDVEIEDTLYVVTTVEADEEGRFAIRLNDATTEPLDPDSLSVGADDVLYCRVKNGTERARFLRPAYYQLAHFIEEVGPGRFQLRCGPRTHPIV